MQRTPRRFGHGLLQQVQDADCVRAAVARNDRAGRGDEHFFRRDEDLAGFLVVTLGAGLETENVRLLQRDQYQD